MADPDPTLTKWKRLYNAFADSQNALQHRRHVLAFIRFAMKPERYARDARRFEPLRANLNRALAFAGLAVEASGQLVVADVARTLSEADRRAQALRADLTSRGVHPDVMAFRRDFVRQSCAPLAGALGRPRLRHESCHIAAVEDPPDRTRQRPVSRAE